jgi:hypothetical protein
MGTMIDDGQHQPHDLMRWFDGKHLRHPVMRAQVDEYQKLARQIDETLPPSEEKTVALRKLLESKDAAVRAILVIVEGSEGG